MSTVNVTIGAKNELAVGLAKAKRDVQQWSKEVSAVTNRAMSGAAGGGGVGNKIGQVSMQAQDIAVQLQMGTSKLQVFAQQAPQILSVFGPGGALLGGLAAVGGAMASVSVKGVEALNNLRISSDQLVSSLAKAGKTGDFDTIETAVAAAEAKLPELEAEAQKTTGTLAKLGGFIKSVFDPDDGANTIGEAWKKAQVDAQNAEVAAIDAVVKAEGDLVKAAEDRATQAERAVSMTDEQIAAQERQKKLAKEIASIESKNYKESTKEGLKAAAIRRSEAEAEKQGAKAQEQRAKEREKRNEDFIKNTQAEAAQAIDDEMNPGAAKARKKADRARERAAEKVIDKQIKKEERDARTDGFKDFGKTADEIQKERRDRRKGLVDAALGKGGDDVGANTGKILGIMQGLKDLLVKK